MTLYNYNKLNILKSLSVLGLSKGRISSVNVRMCFSDTLLKVFKKIFYIRQTRRNFKIILVMTTAGRRAGAALSCPVSSYLNGKFQNREKVTNSVTCTFYS